MENEKGTAQESKGEPQRYTKAHVSVGFGLAAFIWMGITVITDNVFLLFPLCLIGVAGVVSGVLHLFQSESDRPLAVFGIVLSGIWAFLGAGFTFALVMWDSHL